jgi:hypothetical protein
VVRLGYAVDRECLDLGDAAHELSIGLLVWNKRWWVRILFAGVVLHLSIMLTVVIAFFSSEMFVLCLAFVPTETATAIAEGDGEVLELPPAPSKPAPTPRDGRTCTRVRREPTAQQRRDRHGGHSTERSGPAIRARRSADRQARSPRRRGLGCRTRPGAPLGPVRHPFGHDVVGMKRAQHHPGGRGGVKFGGGGGGGGGVSPSKMLWATLPWPE